MPVRCKLGSHDTSSGEEKIEVDELWFNQGVYYCNRCETVLVYTTRLTKGEWDIVVNAAEDVLDTPSSYNTWTVEAAEKVMEEYNNGNLG